MLEIIQFLFYFVWTLRPGFSFWWELGGGFKHFLFLPLPGEMIQIAELKPFGLRSCDVTQVSSSNWFATWDAKHNEVDEHNPPVGQWFGWFTHCNHNRTGIWLWLCIYLYPLSTQDGFYQQITFWFQSFSFVLPGNVKGAADWIFVQDRLWHKKRPKGEQPEF